MCFRKGAAEQWVDAQDGEWKLIRGPVSHGCQRMQGEHIVELASLIGVDMSTTVFTGAAVTGLNVPARAQCPGPPPT